MKKMVIYLVIAMLLIMIHASFRETEAQKPDKCLICGMDLSKFPHTRYTVTSQNGKTTATCGVQCGLLLQLNLGKDFKSALATDFISAHPIQADKAVYLYKSSAVPDMSPGFIAFGNETQAKNFQKGFGGDLLKFEDALKLRAEMK